MRFLPDVSTWGVMVGVMVGVTKYTCTTIISVIWVQVMGGVWMSSNFYWSVIARWPSNVALTMGLETWGLLTRYSMFARRGINCMQTIGLHMWLVLWWRVFPRSQTFRLSSSSLCYCYCYCYGMSLKWEELKFFTPYVRTLCVRTLLFL